MPYDHSPSSSAPPAASVLRLPVAPRVNALCKYAGDGASLENLVLTPGQALACVRAVLSARPALAAVLLAGPGDPLATPADALAVLRLIREACPDLPLGLAANGLSLAAHLDDLVQAGLSRVTLVWHASDPAIVARLHAWIRPGVRNAPLAEGAARLVNEQIQAARALAARGLPFDVHALLVPGVNDDHLATLAEALADLGASAMRVDPGRPIPDFAADLPDRPVPADLLDRVRQAVARHLPLAAAPAEDASLAEALRQAAALPPDGVQPDRSRRPYLAVASTDAENVDLHLGEAAAFLIIAKRNGRLVLTDRRDAPEPGGGPARWEKLAAALADCRTVLVSGAGQTPMTLLAKAGLPVKIIQGPFALEASAILD